jgi:hypothetical protein
MMRIGAGFYGIEVGFINSWLASIAHGCGIIAALGYDPRIQQFTGTFVSSIDSTLWVYSGTLDASGKVLTMEALGPIQKSSDGKLKFHDRIAIVDANHRRVGSEALAENGQWVVFQRSLYTRVGR